jgi:hypothetical protein
MSDTGINELQPAYCDDEAVCNPPTWARKLHILLGFYEDPRSESDQAVSAKRVCRLLRVHLEQKYHLLATSPIARAELAKWRIQAPVEEARNLQNVPLGDVAADEQIRTLAQAMERIQQLEDGVDYMRDELERYKSFVAAVPQKPCDFCGHPLDDRGKCSACEELIAEARAAR